MRKRTWSPDVSGESTSPYTPPRTIQRLLAASDESAPFGYHETHRHIYGNASRPAGPSRSMSEQSPDPSSAQFKYKKRSRAPAPGACQSCGTSDTPEWRRGPDGARTLCNACGLHFAKLVRKRNSQRDAWGNHNCPPVTIEELRASTKIQQSGGNSDGASPQPSGMNNSGSMGVVVPPDSMYGSGGGGAGSADSSTSAFTSPSSGGPSRMAHLDNHPYFGSAPSSMPTYLHS